MIKSKLKAVLATAIMVMYPHYGEALAQTANNASPYTALYQRLEIQPLPNNVARHPTVSQFLAILNRETCDWDAVYQLAVSLHTLGYKREAAGAFLYYSRKCSTSNVALHRAAGILYDLKDLDAAAKVANELVAEFPDHSQFHYTRALIFKAAGKYDEAVDAYETTIALTDDIAHLRSSVFRDTAESYAGLGRYCEAITPLQTWIGIDPEKNDTADIRRAIKRYEVEGRCGTSYATGKGKLRIRKSGGVIMVKASINGVTGNFVVDTGASLVSVNRKFAERARMPLFEKSNIRLQTANGAVNAKRSVVDKVELGKVSAHGVGAVILTDSERPLGRNVDGLLGQSFLSRFQITITRNELLIDAR
nr:retropepsin-like aspartic protease [Ochrobactrum sp. LM19]